MPARGWLALRNGLASPADRRRALRLARGDPRAVRAPARPQRLPWAVVALCGIVRAAVPYSIGRVAGWISEVAIVYLLLAFPSGRLPGRVDRALVIAAALLIGLLYVPTALLVDAFPAPSTRPPAARTAQRTRSASRRDARVGQRRGHPGARGALGPAPAARPLAARVPAARTRRASCGARSRRSWSWRSSAMFSLGPVDHPRRAGVDDDVSATWLAGTLRSACRSSRSGSSPACWLAALHRRRAAAARAPAARRAQTRSARQPRSPRWSRTPRSTSRTPGRAARRLGHRRRVAGGAARAGVRPRGHRSSSPTTGPVAALIHDAGLASSGRSSRRSAASRSSGTRTSASPSASTARNDELQGLAGAHPRGGRRRAPADRARPARRRPAAARRAADPAPARRGDDGPAARRAPASCSSGSAHDVDGALDELRSLAAGVYPAALAAHGLARRASAPPRDGSPLPVHVVIGARRAIPTRSRPRRTSAASRRCRTWPSTRRTRPRRGSCSSSAATSLRGPRRRARLRREGRRSAAG